MRTCLVVVALAAVALAGAAASSDGSFPPPTLPYCNPDPNAIPPLSAAAKALNPKLELVNVFVRHGDRTLAVANICWPDDAMDWDCKLRQLEHTSLSSDQTSAELGRVYRLQYMPNREEEKGDCGIGQLTEVGYKQHLINGGHLRDAYVTRVGLLPETYEEAPEMFFLRADNSRRTQMSGQALFSGLYPETQGADTKIFPFYTRDEKVDDILPNSVVCPLLTEATEAVLATPEAKQFEGQVEELLAEVNALLGTHITAPGDLWDCLHVHICHQFPIPAVLTEDIFNRIVNLTFFEATFPAFYNNTRVGRLGIGPLVSEMYGNMQSIRNGTENPVRFWLYSGHDSGPIMPMLAVYHVPNYHAWCPYASMITVEMYTADTPSGYAVRFVYNGDAVLLPGCGGTELCDYDAFAALTEDIIPSPVECGLVQA